MNDKPNFTIEYLDDAVEFMRSIDVKAAKKLLQTIDVATMTNDPKKFKKLENSNI